jgi:hypothetical protein
MNRRELLNAIQERLKVRVTTRIRKGEHTHGFPLDFSKTFWLLQEECDFRLLGYVVIPTGNIAAVRFGKYEKVMDRMLQAEGISARVKTPRNIDLNSFQGLFQSLQARNKNIIIEASRHRVKTAMYIGPITECGTDHVRIHNFTALGEWDLKPTRILHRDICRIQFESPYANIFSKYLPARDTK